MDQNTVSPIDMLPTRTLNLRFKYACRKCGEHVAPAATSAQPIAKASRDPAFTEHHEPLVRVYAVLYERNFVD